MSGSLWYHLFNIGMKYRMGAIWKPNKGFSVKLLLEMLRRAEEKRSMCNLLQEKHVWTVFVTYAVVSYVLSFRGNKGFLLDLKGTRENLDRRDNKVFWKMLRRTLQGKHVDAINFAPYTHYQLWHQGGPGGKDIGGRERKIRIDYRTCYYKPSRPILQQ